MNSQANTNRKSLLCFVLLLIGVAVIPIGAAQPQPVPALRVVIIPSTTNVRVREPFGLALRVENFAQTNQTICVMTCSWDDEWQSSNTNVFWIGWKCTANVPVTVTIPPGGAYTNKLSMYIYNLIPDKEVSFRMGFTFIGEVKALWSNEVKLNILPPDTRHHGAKYFRDRNHGGKIDWEVSGTTWMDYWTPK